MMDCLESFILVITLSSMFFISFFVMVYIIYLSFKQNKEIITLKERIINLQKERENSITII